MIYLNCTTNWHGYNKDKINGELTTLNCSD